jgi:hypothetical protein
MIAGVILLSYMYYQQNDICPPTLHRNDDGSYETQPGGKQFADMNAFQQWWYSSGLNERCTLPLMTGSRSIILGAGVTPEELYATTPINKVDDYELSRIYGVEKGGRMAMPREITNRVVFDRSFDWAELPQSSEFRPENTKAATVEGFSAERDAVARYGERTGDEHHEEERCKRDKEDREVHKLVERAYEDDPNWRPVITKVAPGQWEVNELVPRRREVGYAELPAPADNRVVNTDSTAVDLSFKYDRNVNDYQSFIDPYFGGLPATGATSSPTGDAFYGPVPGMDRMFGPTFDTVNWS